MDQLDGIQLHNFTNKSISPPTLHKDTNITILRMKELPKIGNIWIPKCARSPNHFTQFFIPRIEHLFQTRDKLLKIEASGVSS
jgi:hypothetical protein